MKSELIMVKLVYFFGLSLIIVDAVHGGLNQKIEPRHNTLGAKNKKWTKVDPDLSEYYDESMINSVQDYGTSDERFTLQNRGFAQSDDFMKTIGKVVPRIGRRNGQPNNKFGDHRYSFVYPCGDQFSDTRNCFYLNGGQSSSDYKVMK